MRYDRIDAENLAYYWYNLANKGDFSQIPENYAQRMDEKIRAGEGQSVIVKSLGTALYLGYERGENNFLEIGLALKKDNTPTT